MSNVILFPDRMGQRQEEDDGYDLPPLLGIPHLELWGDVVMANTSMFSEFGVQELAEKIELFLDPAYPVTILADVDGLTGKEAVKGLYYVELTTYKLIKLSDCPLVHFK